MAQIAVDAEDVEGTLVVCHEDVALLGVDVLLALHDDGDEEHAQHGPCPETAEVLGGEDGESADGEQGDGNAGEAGEQETQWKDDAELIDLVEKRKHMEFVCVVCVSVCGVKNVCVRLRCLSGQAPRHEALQGGRVGAPPAGIVLELVGSHVADVEIACRGMCEHQSAGGGVREHHAVVRECDAESVEGQAGCDVEDEALVGHGRISHGGAYLGVHRLVAEGLQHLGMDVCGGGLCQTVEQRLAHHGGVGVVVGRCAVGCRWERALPEAGRQRIAARASGRVGHGVGRVGYGCGKESDAAGRRGCRLSGGRGDEVGQAEAGCGRAHMLLAQEAEPCGGVCVRGGEHDVVTLAPGPAPRACGTCQRALFGKAAEHGFGLVAQGSGLGMFGIDAPGKEEVYPVDGAQEFAGRIFAVEKAAIGRCA